ncbi:hypothetical protein ACM5Q9_01965 [Advenella sp. RU8]|uniref:hypothetical protein n=1 Tax=Advenella sp. RU8 TaxID=3399575 RepID=UPI003AAD6EF4
MFIRTLLTTTGLLCIASLSQAATVAEVFNGEMLGTNQRYFESIAGIPRESYDNVHEFRVQGCEIQATVSDERIAQLRLEITPTCKADLTSFIGNYAPAPDQTLTLGAFDIGTTYYADCLDMCGNAFDPSLYALWRGPRAVRDLEVLLEARITSDKAMDAADIWQQHMEKVMGREWVLETRFNCDNRFNDVAEKVLRDVPVTGVTLGYGLSAPGC